MVATEVAIALRRIMEVHTVATEVAVMRAHLAAAGIHMAEVAMRVVEVVAIPVADIDRQVSSNK